MICEFYLSLPQWSGVRNCVIPEPTNFVQATEYEESKNS